MSGVTFDWDDRNADDPLVRNALEELSRRFGAHHIWYRTSSSGNGLHIMVGSMKYVRANGGVHLAPITMSVAHQFALRKEFGEDPWVDDQGPLECPGRFISDSARSVYGFSTSRIFGVKTDADGEPALCGLWICWGGNDCETL